MKVYKTISGTIITDIKLAKHQETAFHFQNNWNIRYSMDTIYAVFSESTTIIWHIQLIKGPSTQQNDQYCHINHKAEALELTCLHFIFFLPFEIFCCCLTFFNWWQIQVSKIIANKTQKHTQQKLGKLSQEQCAI